MYRYPYQSYGRSAMRANAPWRKPYKKPYQRRTRDDDGEAAPSTRTIARRALSTARTLSRRMTREVQEVFNGTSDHIIDGVGAISSWRINNTEEGTGQDTRIGEDLEGKDLLINIHIALGAEPASASWYRRCRVIIFNAKSSVTGSGVSTQWSDLLNNTKQVVLGVTTTWDILEADMCGYNRRNVPGNFEILKDMVCKIDQDDPFFKATFSIPFKKSCKYSSFTGGSDYQYTNQAQIMVIPLDATHSPAAGNQLFTYGARFRFYEA